MTKEELLNVLEDRARDAIVKESVGIGGENARGFANGFAYGLLWCGLFTPDEIDAAYQRGIQAGQAINQRRQADV